MHPTFTSSTRPFAPSPPPRRRDAFVSAHVAASSPSALAINAATSSLPLRASSPLSPRPIQLTLPERRILASSYPNLSSSTLSTSDTSLRVFRRLDSRLAMYAANVSHIVSYCGARQTLSIIEVRAFPPSNPKDNQQHWLPSPAQRGPTYPLHTPPDVLRATSQALFVFDAVPLAARAACDTGAPAVHAASNPVGRTLRPPALPNACGERFTSVTSPLSPICAVRPSFAEFCPCTLDTALLPSLVRRAAPAHVTVVHDRRNAFFAPHAHHGHRLRHIRLNAWRARPRIRGAPPPACPAAAASHPFAALLIFLGINSTVHEGLKNGSTSALNTGHDLSSVLRRPPLLRAVRPGPVAAQPTPCIATTSGTGCRLQHQNIARCAASLRTRFTPRRMYCTPAMSPQIRFIVLSAYIYGGGRI
ncbi:hypothetical protein B0H13DRAFT_2484768 [Mycena leptocephala]|nr:hypothetical protein B0H13DRAFT_2484768 [Mycena leptocephala]